MSKNTQGSSKSKLPTATIKIAATNGSRSGSGGGTGPPTGADVGPGDPAAAPSVVPELVDVPDPPTPSQLVVKSTSPSNSAREDSAQEVSEGAMGNSGSGAYTASAGPEAGASGVFGTEPPSGVGSGSRKGPGSVPGAGIGGSNSRSNKSGPVLGRSAVSGFKSVSGASKSGAGSKSSSNVASGVPASGFEPSEGLAPNSSVSPDLIEPQPEPTRTGTQVVSLKPSSPASSAKIGTAKQGSGTGTVKSPRDGNKVTKFRYHRRVTVHTTGKVNPNGILDKVTPSNLEDMDPEELIKKTGIKSNNQTHWRIRLRQTKRLTKGGKTTTQTKVAYRDSEGHFKKEGGSSNPGNSRSEGVCKRCEKKLEDYGVMITNKDYEAFGIVDEAICP